MTLPRYGDPRDGTSTPPEAKLARLRDLALDSSGMMTAAQILDVLDQP